MFEAYRATVAERDLRGIPPKLLASEWTAGPVELLKNPPTGEGDSLIDLIVNRVLLGRDGAAYLEKFG